MPAPRLLVVMCRRYRRGHNPRRRSQSRGDRLRWFGGKRTSCEFATSPLRGSVENVRLTSQSCRSRRCDWKRRMPGASSQMNVARDPLLIEVTRCATGALSRASGLVHKEQSLAPVIHLIVKCRSRRQIRPCGSVPTGPNGRGPCGGSQLRGPWWAGCWRRGWVR